jgi:hypothetical protein
VNIELIKQGFTLIKRIIADYPKVYSPRGKIKNISQISLNRSVEIL